MSKAGRPKKDSVGLPERFDIEKYEPARDFDTMGWYEQLVFRKRVFTACEGCLKKGHKDFSRLAKALSLLQDDPIITEQRVWDSVIHIVENEIPNNNPLLGEGIFRSGHLVVDPVIGITVRPLDGSGLTPLMVSNIYDLAPPEDDDTANATFDKNGQCYIDEPALLWRGLPIIAIDTTINDKIILREMRDWLLELRKAERKPPLAFTKNSDFLKWYNSGVLPYLDLLLWKKMGHAFKWSAFINTLSPILDKPVGSESAAMKAAQNYAQKLLNGQTLRTLEAQASREHSQGTQKSGKLFVR